MDQKKNNKANNTSRMLPLVLISITVSAVFAILSVFISFHLFEVNFGTSSNCYTSRSGKLICTFISENGWNEEAYLSVISGFYSTIVTILVVIITLVSTVAFFVLKNSQASLIQEEVESKLPEILKNVDIRKSLMEALKPEVASAVHENYTELQAQIEELQSQVPYAGRLNIDRED